MFQGRGVRILEDIGPLVTRKFSIAGASDLQDPVVRFAHLGLAKKKDCSPLPFSMRAAHNPSRLQGRGRDDEVVEAWDK